jgi:hypothetical protein
MLKLPWVPATLLCATKRCGLSASLMLNLPLVFSFELVSVSSTLAEPRIAGWLPALAVSVSARAGLAVPSMDAADMIMPANTARIRSVMLASLK